VSTPVELHLGIDEGDGGVLVLLHGWPQDSTMWRRVVPALSTRFRCVALDLRGLGRSPAPPQGYGKQDLAADVLHTLAGMRIDRFSVIGHDWGGVLAQLICLAAPQSVSKAMIVGVPSLWNRSNDPRQLLGLLHMPLLASPLGARVAPMLAARILRAGGVADRDVEHYRQMLSEPNRRRASRLYYRSALGEMPKLLRDRPSKPDVSMVFLGGRRDPVVRWAGDIELVADAGHFLPDTRPELVVERAFSFFESA
jgi:pimeloyl-ACP methyl ester carboxylesterase